MARSRREACGRGARHAALKEPTEPTAPEFCDDACVTKRSGRLRSASRGRLPKAAIVPVIAGMVADQVESLWRHARATIRRPRGDAFLPARVGYPTIVPIAGIYERWDYLIPMLRVLNRIGFGVHPVPELGRNLEPVTTLARRLLRHLDDHGLDDVAIVAHSKGGIIGKVALLRDGEARIRHVIALATPFKGSAPARLARDQGLAALAPASRATVKLSLNTSVDDRITSIYATFDEMLAVPNQVARGTNIEAIRVGHNTVLSSREVTEFVAVELARIYGLPQRLAPEREPWPARLAGRKRDIVRDYAYAIGWQLRSLVPDRGRLERWRRADAGRIAVVLVPGVLERWPFMRSIGDRLYRQGHPVFVVPELGNNRGSVPHQARVVGAFLAREGLDRVVIVAHSKGGLIGKLAMSQPEVGKRIAGMVTVATPFGGSPYARWFVAPSIREFSPRHRVIRALDAVREANSRIVSIWPSFDQHIPTSSVLPGARANVVVPGTGHFRILSSRVVVNTVAGHVSAIEADAVKAPEGPAATIAAAMAPVVRRRPRRAQR